MLGVTILQALPVGATNIADVRSVTTTTISIAIVAVGSNSEVSFMRVPQRVSSNSFLLRERGMRLFCCASVSSTEHASIVAMVAFAIATMT